MDKNKTLKTEFILYEKGQSDRLSISRNTEYRTESSEVEKLTHQFHQLISKSFFSLSLSGVSVVLSRLNLLKESDLSWFT